VDSLPLTDSGNGTRFADQHHQVVRFVPDLGHWLFRRNNKWVIDVAGQRYQRAVETARSIVHEAPDAGHDERRAIYRHALHSENADGLERMLRCASRDSRIVVRAAELDSDPWAFGVANGVIDLRTGLPRPEHPDELITKRSPAWFKGAGEGAPAWDAFLARVLPSEQVRGFVQRAVGYSMTGDVGEHALFLPYGGGANGKSTLLEVVRAVLGDYARAAAPGLLMATREGRHEEELAELMGVRFATCVESGQDQAFNEPRLKYLTGGDTISARFLYSRRFEFRPTHKLWLATNHKPRVRGGDDGVWRRIKLIPFLETIPEKERDPRLKEKLLDEASGILAWAVRGCLLWQRDGLGAPEEVNGATAEYRESEDRIGAFLADACVLAPGARVVASRLFEAYREWAEGAGERALSPQAFAEALEARGFDRKRTSIARMWVGLGLRVVSGDGVTDPEVVLDKSPFLSLAEGGCPK
jgi:putative DNA primase/helicase